ncbi:phycobiliprotein lyase [Leptolyngbya iicbica]|uniref:Chromophore lyase CpcS/CpeS n=2 Tax=Cyanophyceae TaxID=3028117 RepID=A0A4Q7EFA0_9CYAN|nr:phycobiliprotein lyase [Leptolyngbya sp. LK]RZM81902.1 phycobiliprotein lyase [Leptolyngbya sp. LK]
MSIVNFFETVEGTWFSQRTTHFAPGQPSQTGQATLKIARVETSDARVTALCQQCNADANAAIFAYTIQQEGQASLYGSGAATPPRTTLMVGLKSDDDCSGQFFSQTDREPAIAGKYCLEGEVLTLSVRNEEFQSDERLWYMNPNLRMRTSLVKRADGYQMASFCSEIRRSS